jgi:hypothetical protein
MEDNSIRAKGRITLKEYFEAEKMPTEGEFNDLINSSLNKKDDQLFISPKGEGGNAARFLGIGSSDPESPLSIRNRTGDEKLIGLENSGGEEKWNIAINPIGGDNGFVVRNNDNPDVMLMINTNGNVGIGKNKPLVKLDVNGVVGCNNFRSERFSDNRIDLSSLSNSTSWYEMPEMNFTFFSGSRPVLVMFRMSDVLTYNIANGVAEFRMMVDGEQKAYCSHAFSSNGWETRDVVLTRLFNDLPLGAHTISIQWSVRSPNVYSGYWTGVTVTWQEWVWDWFDTGWHTFSRVDYVWVAAEGRVYLAGCANGGTRNLIAIEL